MKTFFAVIGAIFCAIFILPLGGLVIMGFYMGLSNSLGSHLKETFGERAQTISTMPASQTTIVARTSSPDVVVKPPPKPIPVPPQPPSHLQPAKTDLIEQVFNADDPALMHFDSDEHIPEAVPASSTPSTSSPSSKAPLHIDSWKCTSDEMMMKVEGSVTNTSDHSIESPIVIGEFYSSDKKLITSASGFVDYGSILPGQSSPFSAMTVNNPAMASCKLGFRALLGGAIATWKD